MAEFAYLGTFTLGDTALGDSPLLDSFADFMTLTEAIAGEINEPVEDSMALSEAFPGSISATFEDDMAFSEFLEALGYGIAGIKGKITQRIDLDSTDFCTAVDESGFSLELNDVPGRGFCYIKQRGQKFDHGIETHPGDAVLFTCPTDPVMGLIAVGGVVKFDLQEFEVTAVRNKYVDGNIIFKKSALRKIRTIPPMPQVINVIASPNLEGKTSLTWDEVDYLSYPWFDHYEVLESLDDITYYLREKVKSNSLLVKNIQPNVVYYYKVQAIDKYGRAGAASAAAATPTDTTPPDAPGGLR